MHSYHALHLRSDIRQHLVSTHLLVGLTANHQLLHDVVNHTGSDYQLLHSLFSHLANEFFQNLLSAHLD